MSREDGEPRYRVSRLTKRRIFAKYGVFAGTGTAVLFSTYRFNKARLVADLLGGAFADGHFQEREDRRFIEAYGLTDADFQAGKEVGRE